MCKNMVDDRHHQKVLILVIVLPNFGQRFLSDGMKITSATKS